MVNAKILKELTEPIAPVLSIIFKTSYETGRLPSKWKEANISAIYKKGGKHHPENYRPISLTSIICKIMESLIKESLLEFLKNTNALSDRQFGFLPGRSTVLQLLNVLDKWTEALDNGAHVDAIYCDFMKAFDTVPHQRLLRVLRFYNTPENLVKWIEDFLTERKHRVPVNGVFSKWHDVISGVPQGSVLGPVLFVAYINALPDETESSDIFLFADDNKLFKNIYNDSDTLLLQRGINKMHSWSTNSLLRFHPDKCYSINIRSKSKQYCYHNYKMNYKDLENKSKIKDLGIIVDENLRFSNHIINKVNKADQIMGVIRRTMVYLNRHNFSLLYTSLVRPHLKYGNVVWSPFLKSDITLIENVQRRATRHVPDINKLEYQERLEALNLPTLQYRRFRADIIEMFKITHGHFEDNCVKHLFEMKSTNTRGHQYALKITHSNTTTRRLFV